MTLAGAIKERGISEVIHFTTNRGIVGTLATGALLSRHLLPQEKYLEKVLHVNAASRPESWHDFDKSQNWLDYVNLSISEINRRYFEFSSKWHKDSEVWWAILAFDPVIMTHDGVFFATTNNAYEPFCSRALGISGFTRLFDDRVTRKSDWTVSRMGRAAHLTTCEQAEVLYPQRVSVDFLRRIYVREGEHQDQARGLLTEFGLQTVDVAINPAKFVGCKN
ncbi:DarT ssDNA thymidine ADP-ribosyltransferase family protein [Xanthomonas oryzae]|uniref:DarT ssDNA thymidine ADP-ribosyltransferase family protein n=1 Tax=Xanthomonas oryzae TaxID=347 RepID=UPI000DDC8092|nr:DarT ssDNA thymidine ADP-ribosyltransferase family protein [Xanthomonas oryzae]RBJ37955.1 DUF4433 domain-containing protein [Xanthomonas oryzae pv. oryzae]